MWIPIYPPKKPYHEDSLFDYLRQEVHNTPAHKRTHTSWISEETWRVINVRVSLRISPDRCQH